MNEDRMSTLYEIDNWVKNRIKRGGDSHASWKYNQGYDDALRAVRSYLHRLRENEREEKYGR